jgi:MarR family transcriptional regulator for hemolysin
VDRVHREALSDLTDGEREVLLRALRRMAEGQLAVPAAPPAPVRRARQRTA